MNGGQHAWYSAHTLPQLPSVHPSILRTYIRRDLPVLTYKLVALERQLPLLDRRCYFAIYACRRLGNPVMRLRRRLDSLECMRVLPNIESSRAGFFSPNTLAVEKATAERQCGFEPRLLEGHFPNSGQGTECGGCVLRIPYSQHNRMDGMTPCTMPGSSVDPQTADGIYQILRTEYEYLPRMLRDLGTSSTKWSGLDTTKNTKASKTWEQTRQPKFSSMRHLSVCVYDRANSRLISIVDWSQVHHLCDLAT